MELDSLIYDGSTYGTGAMVNSEEEADYLGLPGLLDAEQMRALLKQRQADQVEARADEERKKREEQQKQAASTPATAETESAVASDEIPNYAKNSTQ